MNLYRGQMHCRVSSGRRGVVYEVQDPSMRQRLPTRVDRYKNEGARPSSGGSAGVIGAPVLHSGACAVY